MSLPRLHVHLLVLLALTAAPGAHRDDGGTPLPDAPRRTAKEAFDRPDEAVAFFLQQRAGAGDKSALSVERYVEAWQAARRLPLHSSVAGRAVDGHDAATKATALEWSELGPRDGGGRTRALAIDPRRPDTMYAGGVSGGVWRSTDGGASWSPRGDLMANLAVASLALDPAQPDRLYAGTGEGLFNFDALRGAGIFVSDDAGASWMQLAATDTPDFHYVNDLVASPTVAGTLYAATRTGVWRSTDRGATWVRRLLPGTATNPATPVYAGCTDLEVRAYGGRDLAFAACGSFVQATVYRDLDAAAAGSWEAVLTEPGMGRTALAIAPSDPGTVYAIAASVTAGTYQHALHAVFRSDAAGAPDSWTAQVRNTDPNPLNTVLLSYPDELVCANASHARGQGWYDLAIAVDPVDAQRVWVGGIDIFRSDDGGRNWGRANYWYLDGIASAAHADVHGLVFHPHYDGVTQTRLYTFTDGGIYTTTDPTAPTAKVKANFCPGSTTLVRGPSWTPLNDGYGTTQFVHGDITPDGATWFAGAQDNGTLRGGVAPTRRVLGGDGGYVAIDRRDPNTVYAATTGISVRKSIDDGATFVKTTSGIVDSGLFIAPYALDPADGRILWTGGSALWRSENGAASWQPASTALAGTCAAEKISAIAIDPDDSRRVIAATSCGRVLRHDAALTAGAGSTWLSSRPRDGYVASLAWDPNAADTVYATYSTFGGAHVWKSVDAGVTWGAVDGTGAATLPDLPVHTLVVAPGDPDLIWIGTDLGVFVTLDGGDNWRRENTGFANVVTEHLVLTPSGVTGHELTAFTRGRGAFRAAITLDRLFGATFE